MVDLQQEKANQNTEKERQQEAPVKKILKGDDVSIKYRGLSYEMAVELHFCEEDYFFWDLPVPFNNKLQIYPVMVRDYNKFMDAVGCLLLDKKQLPPNSSPADIKKQFKMTDLEFLVSKFDDPQTAKKFIQIIELCLHLKNGMRCPKCGHIMDYNEYQKVAQKLVQQYVEQLNNSEFSQDQNDEEKTVELLKKIQDKQLPAITCPECGSDGLYETIRYEENEETHRVELFIDGQKIDFKDFIRLKNIILFQNLPDYRDTSYIDPSLKKDYETQRRIRREKNGNKTATLEKELAALKVFMGLSSYDDLYKLTVRKFLIEKETMDDLMMYSFGMMGRFCGLGGGPKEIEHWIYKEVKDVYADGGYVSKDTVMEKTKNIR